MSETSDEKVSYIMAVATSALVVIAAIRACLLQVLHAVQTGNHEGGAADAAPSLGRGLRAAESLFRAVGVPTHAPPQLNRREVEQLRAITPAISPARSTRDVSAGVRIEIPSPPPSPAGDTPDEEQQSWPMSEIEMYAMGHDPAAACQCLAGLWCPRHDQPLAGHDTDYTPSGDVFIAGPYAGQRVRHWRDASQRTLIDRCGHAMVSNGRDALPASLNAHAADVIMGAFHAARFRNWLPVLVEHVVALALLVTSQQPPAPGAPSVVDAIDVEGLDAVLEDGEVGCRGILGAGHTTPPPTPRHDEGVKAPRRDVLHAVSRGNAWRSATQGRGAEPSSLDPVAATPLELLTTDEALAELITDDLFAGFDRAFLPALRAAMVAEAGGDHDRP